MLTVTLAESHVVHTKIYPRYKSRKAIEFATDDFSNWLCPHENENTDVVLVGHSMGGILAAEVALLPPYSPTSNEAFRHHILGVVAFDVPFLGMHPGVISTGIASLFQPKSEKPDEDGHAKPNTTASAATSSTTSLEPISLFESVQNDPNFNPAFPNDKHLIERKGWEKAAYFISKHSDGLTKATKQYFWSHLEFGGCLADYPGLQRRYKRLRALEDVDEFQVQKDEDGKILNRVRFVNYYTASSGRIKTPKSPKSEVAPPVTEMKDMSMNRDEDINTERLAVTPTVSVDSSYVDDDIDSLEGSVGLSLQDPTPFDGHTEETVMAEEVSLEDLGLSTSSKEIPPLPKPPPSFDPGLYNTSESLKSAQKGHNQAVKVYERALKDREKAIKERDKAIKKREKEFAKDKANSDKAAAKALAQVEKQKRQQEKMEEKERVKRQATINPEVYDRQLERDRIANLEYESNRKKQKDRKFCSLPSKSMNGQRDPTWVRVYMDGVDEVVAHTSLFFVSETYERLVGDTAARVEGWVNEDRTTKLLLQEQHNVD